MRPETRRGRAGNTWFPRWCFLGVALLFTLPPVGLSARSLPEYERKAAFLLNFARFVEWPPRAFPEVGAPLVIGIVGEDPFGEALPKVVHGQTAQGRRITIHRFTAAEDGSGCQLLFLSRSVAGQADAILQRLQNRPVLTVSEQEDFVRRGGVIGFAMVNNRVRFDINLTAAETARLKVSSKLLAVARAVLKTS